MSFDFGTITKTLLPTSKLGWPIAVARDRYTRSEDLSRRSKVSPLALVSGRISEKQCAKILDTYRTRIPSFNDDIQGTGAVVLAGIEMALSRIGEDITAQRIVVLGAGAGGLGIVRQIRAQWSARGVAERDQQARVAVLDRKGLIVESEETDAYKRELAWPVELARHHGLEARSRRDLAHVSRPQATILIGASGHGGAFTEAMVREMRVNTPAPSFSLLQSHGELPARPEELFNGSDVAAWSPREPVSDVEYGGRDTR